MEIVPILNEAGEVVGQEERSVAHEKELLHPGVRIVMKLPDGRFVFQQRSPSKETNPGKMTFAATGHVKAGQEFVEAAREELFEETGVRAEVADLTYLGVHQDKLDDWEIGKRRHRVRGYFYGYRFPGKLEDLKAEKGEVDWFAAYSLAELEALSPEERKKFVDLIFVPEIMQILKSYENKD